MILVKNFVFESKSSIKKSDEIINSWIKENSVKVVSYSNTLNNNDLNVPILISSITYIENDKNKKTKRKSYQIDLTERK